MRGVGIGHRMGRRQARPSERSGSRPAMAKQFMPCGVPAASRGNLMAGQDYRHAGGDCRHHRGAALQVVDGGALKSGAPRNAVFHRRAGKAARAAFRRGRARLAPPAVPDRALAGRPVPEPAARPVGRHDARHTVAAGAVRRLVGVRERPDRTGRPARARLSHADRRRRAGRHGRLAGAVDRGHAGLPAGRQPLVPGGPALRFAPAWRGLQAVAVAGFLHPPDAAAVPARRARCWCASSCRARARCPPSWPA